MAVALWLALMLMVVGCLVLVFWGDLPIGAWFVCVGLYGYGVVTPFVASGGLVVFGLRGVLVSCGGVVRGLGAPLVVLLV